MPFSHLAAVEVQLIMQMCDLHSLLRLARCSRATMVAATTSAMAWRFCPPVRMFFHGSLVQHGAKLSGSRLLSRATVAICSPVQRYHLTSADIAHALALSRAHAVSMLDLRSAECSGAKLLEPLLAAEASPLRSSLTTLRIGSRCTVSFETVASVARNFPSLAALSLHLRTCSLFLPLLSSFPGLRCLTLDEHDYRGEEQVTEENFDEGEGEQDQLFYDEEMMDEEEQSDEERRRRARQTGHRLAGVEDAVAACTRLEELHLIDVSVDAVLPLCATRNLRGLRSLVLEHFVLSSIGAEEWGAALANLVALRTLAFLRCEGVSHLLTVVGRCAAPTLESLRVEFDLLCAEEELIQSDSAPGEALLAAIEHTLSDRAPFSAPGCSCYPLEVLLSYPATLQRTTGAVGWEMLQMDVRALMRRFPQQFRSAGTVQN